MTTMMMIVMIMMMMMMMMMMMIIIIIIMCLCTQTYAIVTRTEKLKCRTLSRDGEKCFNYVLSICKNDVETRQTMYV
jgi:hypothetical protein